MDHFALEKLLIESLLGCECPFVEELKGIAVLLMQICSENCFQLDNDFPIFFLEFDVLAVDFQIFIHIIGKPLATTETTAVMRPLFSKYFIHL